MASASRTTVDEEVFDVRAKPTRYPKPHALGQRGDYLQLRNAKPRLG